MTIKTKLLTTAAIAGFAAFPAFAEKHSNAEMTSEGGMTSEYAQGWNEDLDSRYADIADQQVAELIGMNVVSDTGEDVGEVDNFVLIDDTLRAVVGVGGFLGLGEHEVALDLSELQFDGENLVVSYTKEELEAMPEYTEETQATALNETDTFRTRTTEMASGDMAESDPEEAAAPSGEEVAAAEEASPGEEDPVEEQVAEEQKGEIEQEAEEIAAEADAAMESAEQTAENAAEATENAAEAAGQEVAEAAEATENAAENAAQETEQVAENAAEATENAAEEVGQEVAEAAEATENAVENAAQETEQVAENAAAGAASWLDKLEGEFADIASWEVNEFEGTNVATANGDVIGEIDNLGMQGDALVAIIGIGGFLGLGEHDVAIDLANLSWNGENFVVDGMTEEQLKAMPEYDSESVEMLDNDITLQDAARM